MCFRSSPNYMDMNLVMNDTPVYPFNTGIPLSVQDPGDVMNRSQISRLTMEHNNLLYNSNQIGLNSSCDEEEE